ncbi:MAG: Ig-like domain-containing protein [Acidobacteriaceae bacterium]|nr:Ig-like domain-containing protein [Acidobacteriaceae bacterium]
MACPCLSIGLSTLLIVVGAAPPLPAQDPAPTKITIEILEGDGAVNNIKQRTAREPIVRVTDENHKPVAGAVVLFTSPSSGPGGLFNGAQTLSVTTNAQGQALGTGFRPNTIKGRYQIQVHATLGQLVADQIIHQANTAPFLGLPTKAWVAIGVAAAGATAGSVAATRGGGGGSSSPTVITPGSPTVTGPR